MAGIQDYLNQIKNAIYGKDVRQAIHDGIQQCYYDGKVGAVDLVARQQIAELVAPSGEAPSAAEVTDARIGANLVTYASLGTANRSQIGGLKHDLNALINEYANVVPMEYSISSNRIDILSAFYTVKDNILRRVILLEIVTDAINSANTWTIGNISNPSVKDVQANVSTIVYQATSLDGGNISNMTFRQNNGSSGNFQLVTTSAVSFLQGGLIMLTHEQPITGTAIAPISETDEPTELYRIIDLSENLFNTRFAVNGYAFNVNSEVVSGYTGWSYAQLRVCGGIRIVVEGLTQSGSTLGYAIKNTSGNIIQKGGVSNRMIIDVPDDGYYLIFSYPTEASNVLTLTPYRRKRVLILGDSWSDTTPSHTTLKKWPAILSERDGFDVINYAQNGSTITGDTPSFAQNGNVLGQFNQMVSDNVQRVDVVIMFGGLNDFRTSASASSVYNKLLDFYNRLKIRFPFARIIYVSNHQLYITEEQINYFKEIHSYIRQASGMECFDTFGWVAPYNFIDDMIHPNNNGNKAIYSNMLAILNGGDIVTYDNKFVKDVYDDGNNLVMRLTLNERWVDGHPTYSAKANVYQRALGNSYTINLSALDRNNLLASVPFVKKFATGSTDNEMKMYCNVAESFPADDKYMNKVNAISVQSPSANANAYYTADYN